MNLKFSHRLSKVIVNLQGDNWPSGDYSLKLNHVFTDVSVDLNALSFSYGDDIEDVIMAANGNMSYKAVLPPANFDKR